MTKKYKKRNKALAVDSVFVKKCSDLKINKCTSI